MGITKEKRILINKSPQLKYLRYKENVKATMNCLNSIL